MVGIADLRVRDHQAFNQLADGNILALRGVCWNVFRVTLKSRSKQKIPQPSRFLPHGQIGIENDKRRILPLLHRRWIRLQTDDPDHLQRICVCDLRPHVPPRLTGVSLSVHALSDRDTQKPCVRDDCGKKPLNATVDGECRVPGAPPLPRRLRLRGNVRRD
jgi:hypothetical protein